MNCKYVNKNLIGYIEQAIPIKLQEEIKEHLNECHACRKLLEEVRATYTVFDKRPVPEVNPFFYSKLEQKLKNKEKREAAFFPEIIWKLRPVAASVLIFIGISMGVFIGNSLYGSGIALKKPDRAEILNAYASEYYLTDTGDDTMNTLISNQ